MQVSAHKSHKTRVFPKKLARKYFAAGTKAVKKSNNQFVKYVTKKPYHTLGYASLAAGLCAGLASAAYFTIKSFIK